MFGCVHRCKSLRSSSNVFLLNLAISDLLMNAKMPIFILNSFYCGPVFGKLGEIFDCILLVADVTIGPYSKRFQFARYAVITDNTSALNALGSDRQLEHTNQIG